MGTGRDAAVEVKLKDGTKLKGYISEANDDHFVVTDAKTGSRTVVPYPQVKKARHGNLVMLAFIGAIAVIAVVVASSAK